jgi:hypothetical protein|tara:strand:- start:12770 stop:14116 length:1347 start_codon:yes stop_codon:yes gene_type:complete
MSKVDLAKKTAKLMIDKLSPKELENELYQLLIILSNNDLDYMYEDVKKGEVAGPPHPVDVLQGSDDRDDADSSLEDEKSRESSYNQRFSLDDFVYGYDAGMDRWLPYNIHKFIDGEDGEDDKYELKEYFAGAPGDVGREIIYYEGELKMQPEDKVFLVQDYLYKNNGKDFVKYIKYQDSLAEKDEGGQLIKDIYIDHGGIVNIEWNDKRMKNYQTQATPFWQDEEEIGVQVSHNESGEELPTGETVYWPNSESFNIGNGIYPNDPDDFYYVYWELLPEIFELSLKIVEENLEATYYDGVEGNEEKLDKALEKWDEKGGKSLTKKEKNLITSSQLWNGNDMPIDYGWHKAVRSFIEMYSTHPDGNKIPAKYKNTSLDEIPRSIFIAPDDETGEVISDEDALDRADTFETQYILFMEDAEKGTYRAGDWYDNSDLLLETPWGGEEELYEE